MGLFAASVLAVLAALLELTLGPYVQIGGVQPHPVLVLAVVGTVGFGLEGGLVLAVAGGLTLDVLAPRPLGSTVFVLLLLVGGAAVAARALAPARFLAPITLTALASPLFGLGLMVVVSIAKGRPMAEDPIALVLPGAIYDTLLAAVIGPLVVSWRARARDEERFEW